MSLHALFIVVQEGMASKICTCACSLGAQGATIMRASGSLPNKFLCFLGLERVQKEIVLMVLTDEQLRYILPQLSEKFSFDRPNHGIAYSVPVDYHAAIKRLPTKDHVMDKKCFSEGPHLIVTIVDRGNAQLVIESANNAGAQGATILHGRGSGVEESEAFFDLNIQPEKDIIFIVAPSHLVVPITETIAKEANLHENGRGIVFTLPIGDAAGIIALQNKP